MRRNSFPEQGWYTRGSINNLHYWDGADWTKEKALYSVSVANGANGATELSGGAIQQTRDDAKTVTNKQIAAFAFLGSTALAAIFTSRLFRK